MENDKLHTIKFDKIHFLKGIYKYFNAQTLVFFPFTICNETTDQGIILQKQLRNVDNWRDHANQAIGRICLHFCLLSPRKQVVTLCVSIHSENMRALQDFPSKGLVVQNGRKTKT